MSIERFRGDSSRSRDGEGGLIHQRGGSLGPGDRRLVLPSEFRERRDTKASLDLNKFCFCEQQLLIQETNCLLGEGELVLEGGVLLDEGGREVFLVPNLREERSLEGSLHLLGGPGNAFLV